MVSLSFSRFANLISVFQNGQKLVGFFGALQPGFKPTQGGPNVPHVGMAVQSIFIFLRGHLLLRGAGSSAQQRLEGRCWRLIGIWGGLDLVGSTYIYIYEYVREFVHPLGCALDVIALAHPTSQKLIDALLVFFWENGELNRRLDSLGPFWSQ